MSSGRILIIRGGAIGDFVLTLPVLQAIKENLPKAKVEVLGYPHIARLAEVAGLAAASRPIEAQAVAGFFARNGELDEEWSEYFERFEIIISYLYDPDEIFQTNVGRCSKAQFIQGPHRPDESENTHATQVFLKPLENLAIFDALEIPRIELSPQERALSDSSSWLLLHPGSGSTSKNWPMKNWEKFVTTLQSETRWNLLVVGGEAERDAIERLRPVLLPERTRLEFRRPLDELAELIAQCSGFVGHDSGISHLAAALGLPGLVLWGPTKSSIWRPQSEAVVLINHESGLPSLPVDQVMARIPPPPKQP